MLNTFIRLAEAMGVAIGEFFYRVEAENPEMVKEALPRMIEEADEKMLRVVYGVLGVAQ